LKTFVGESDPKHPINFIAPGAPSAKPDQFSVGDVQSRVKGDGNSVASVVVRELSKNGPSQSTIAGVLINISPVCLRHLLLCATLRTFDTGTHTARAVR